jgi:hypothetical protein
MLCVDQMPWSVPWALPEVSDTLRSACTAWPWLALAYCCRSVNARAHTHTHTPHTHTHIHTHVVITRQEEQRAELEVLQVERTRAMRGRISDLEAELASAEGKAVDLAGRNAALTSEMRTLRGAADDLLRLLAAPASDAPSVRRELQAKYRVFIGQTGQQEPADGAVAAASSLTQLAGALDGMVKRAERGRGSITALRAAVSDVRAPYCVCVCVSVCVCVCVSVSVSVCVCVCVYARAY